MGRDPVDSGKSDELVGGQCFDLVGSHQRGEPAWAARGQGLVGGCGQFGGYVGYHRGDAGIARGTDVVPSRDGAGGAGGVDVRTPGRRSSGGNNGGGFADPGDCGCGIAAVPDDFVRFTPRRERGGRRGRFGQSSVPSGGRDRPTLEAGNTRRRQRGVGGDSTSCAYGCSILICGIQPGHPRSQPGLPRRRAVRGRDGFRHARRCR